ncbi:hypothetical protein A1OO_03345 [Enterovibrio norvegicus FF-33]|uniref:hypothetical protein n=1 Tax=Enterovibrio norvegicus TaxID=188144 RepID=UPI00037A7107|nr:hypothetical protein [Enterovibrio norvegicus]OEE69830.1 hypothetical protein A1OO_03345 [Enterovibrio norvegicus FF-33]
MFGNETENRCQKYWAQANYILARDLVEEWCRLEDGQEQCRLAKSHALIARCEEGEINTMLTNGKTAFTGRMHEYYKNGILLVEKESAFDWIESFAPDTHPQLKENHSRSVNWMAEVIFRLALQATGPSSGKHYKDADAIISLICDDEFYIGAQTLAKVLKDTGHYE